MITYFVPLKWDFDANIMFLPTPYTTEIFKSVQYSKDTPPSQSKIGRVDHHIDEKLIEQWSRTYFEKPVRHPAIIKFDMKTMKSEYYMDSYIEDFVNENYDEIMEKLNDKSSKS